MHHLTTPWCIRCVTALLRQLPVYWVVGQGSASGVNCVLTRQGLGGPGLLEGHRGLMTVGRLHADGRRGDHITQ